MARETETARRRTQQPPVAGLGQEIIELQKQIDEATPQREATNLELEVARESVRLTEAALAEASAKLRAAANNTSCFGQSHC